MDGSRDKGHVRTVNRSHKANWMWTMRRLYYARQTKLNKFPVLYIARLVSVGARSSVEGFLLWLNKRLVLSLSAAPRTLRIVAAPTTIPSMLGVRSLSMWHKNEHSYVVVCTELPWQMKHGGLTGIAILYESPGNNKLPWCCFSKVENLMRMVTANKNPNIHISTKWTFREGWSRRSSRTV